jgi:hypothetical protein
MRLGLALLVVCTSSSAALARPITLGVAAGSVQSENDNDEHPAGLLEVWARVGLVDHLGAQLEVAKVKVSGSDARLRGATALAVVELGPLGRSVFPVVFGGFGVDSTDDGYGNTQSGTHVEGGVGIELHLDGGLVIGLDARIGQRDSDDEAYVLQGKATPTSIGILPSPGTSGSAEYRAVRGGVGIRF